jgi:hypothetical protein
MEGSIVPIGFLLCESLEVRHERREERSVIDWWYPDRRCTLCCTHRLLRIDSESVSYERERAAIGGEALTTGTFAGLSSQSLLLALLLTCVVFEDMWIGGRVFRRVKKERGGSPSAL